jgi:regulator of protease activity HflC (stomatin/prohibitin superfamily)
MRMKLESEHSKRLSVLLLLSLLVIFVGARVQLYRHPINLPDRLALAGDIVDRAETNEKATLGLRIVVALHLVVIPMDILLLAVILNSLPIIVPLVVIPRLASRFMYTLYDTRDAREAHDFLHRNVFGMTSLRPITIIREGQIAVGAGGVCDQVGGRGVMIIHNDSAAVLEKGGRLTRTVGGPYFGFLEPFERVWEVVDLRRQRWSLPVEAMTKEGIPIVCDADIAFKIDDRFIDDWGEVQNKPPVKTTTQSFTYVEIGAALKDAGIETPLPYTDEAVFKAATSTWVRIRQPEDLEQLRKWTGRVMIGEVEGTLRDILARYRLDWLTRPPRPGDKHPQEEIRELLEHKLRNIFSAENNLGIQILDVNLGKVDVKDERISNQWIKAWQAGWEQRAVESRAAGEAELVRLEAAQVQAQAEMVLTLTEAIRPFVSSAEEFPSYLLAVQFTQTLRWMAYDPLNRVFLPPETLRTIKELENLLNEAGVSLDATETASEPNSAFSEIKRILAGRGMI